LASNGNRDTPGTVADNANSRRLGGKRPRCYRQAPACIQSQDSVQEGSCHGSNTWPNSSDELLPAQVENRLIGSVQVVRLIRAWPVNGGREAVQLAFPLATTLTGPLESSSGFTRYCSSQLLCDTFRDIKGAHGRSSIAFDSFATSLDEEASVPSHAEREVRRTGERTPHLQAFRLAQLNVPNQILEEQGKRLLLDLGARETAFHVKQGRGRDEFLCLPNNWRDDRGFRGYVEWQLIQRLIFGQGDILKSG